MIIVRVLQSKVRAGIVLQGSRNREVWQPLQATWGASWELVKGPQPPLDFRLALSSGSAVIARQGQLPLQLPVIGRADLASGTGCAARDCYEGGCLYCAGGCFLKLDQQGSSQLGCNSSWRLSRHPAPHPLLPLALYHSLLLSQVHHPKVCHIRCHKCWKYSDILGFGGYLMIGLHLAHLCPVA